MLQVIQYNDDEGNQTIAVGDDVDDLKAAAEKHHFELYEESLTWSEQDGSWSTKYEAGTQYAIHSVETV